MEVISQTTLFFLFLKETIFRGIKPYLFFPCICVSISVICAHKFHLSYISESKLVSICGVYEFAL